MDSSGVRLGESAHHQPESTDRNFLTEFAARPDYTF